MEVFNNIDDVLNFAISKEEEAEVFYSNLALNMDKDWMVKVFKNFAIEEKGHREKLIGIKNGKHLFDANKKVFDLKIADYLVDVEPKVDMGYQEALILAMKKEKASFRLYTNLAEITDDKEVKEILLSLAQEEAKHKLRFEIEYDDMLAPVN